ncbi:hypothetical protein [Roseateles oligotrophus]|uniref:Colicin import membrane protein n=1 Tax=Roseateles oligotrophus TaxID=1769250 RepID=A0ABT2YGQ7_9BURK|nr:hypothetical protein [Roseateles oligotrophus]MCV2369245.1 hypothetical protein [Roseateles oligotrophus]
MKRLLVSLLAAALLPAFAQTAGTAKVDPKNNKVSNPVVEKPKAKLMTRDELRACMDQADFNNSEAVAIKADQVAYNDNATALKAEKAELQKGEEAGAAGTATLKKERDGILQMFEEIKAAAPKLEKAELDERNKAYQARAAAFDASVTTLNEGIKANLEKRKAFADKVDAFNASFKALEARQEAHFDKADAWKSECSKKAYDEADEKAIKKERAAAQPK